MLLWLTFATVAQAPSDRPPAVHQTDPVVTAPYKEQAGQWVIEGRIDAPRQLPLANLVCQAKAKGVSVSIYGDGLSVIYAGEQSLNPYVGGNPEHIVSLRIDRTAYQAKWVALYPGPPFGSDVMDKHYGYVAVSSSPTGPWLNANILIGDLLRGRNMALTTRHYRKERPPQLRTVQVSLAGLGAGLASYQRAMSMRMPAS